MNTNIDWKQHAEKAQAACAEMRACISAFSAMFVCVCRGEKWCSKCICDKALSLDCGKGWLSPEKVKLLREALEKIANKRGVCNKFCGCSGCLAQQALDVTNP